MRYYLMLQDSLVKGYWVVSPNPSDLPPGVQLVSATFSSDPNSGADVVTPEGRPLLGSRFIPPSDYTRPGDRLIVAWSGDGTLDGDYYDLTADGTNKATLTVTAEASSGSDVYRILVEGCSVSPTPGKLTLNNGSGSVSFTPAANLGGVAVIKLLPSDPASPINETPIMLSVE